MGTVCSRGVFDASAIPRNFSEIKMKDIRGQERSLSEWDGKVKLIVNVASRCGLTKSTTADLIALREQFGTDSFEIAGLLECVVNKFHGITRGVKLKILAFPCGQFAGQEYKKASDTEAFCERLKIPFPIFETSAVNGPETNPVFLYCKANSDEFYSTSGRLGSVQLCNIGWNYGKFLLDRKNGVYKYYGPRIEAKKLAGDIGGLINGELSGMKRDANEELKPL